jgi:hypothetical protein
MTKTSVTVTNGMLGVIVHAVCAMGGAVILSVSWPLAPALARSILSLCFPGFLSGFLLARTNKTWICICVAPASAALALLAIAVILRWTGTNVHFGMSDYLLFCTFSVAGATAAMWKCDKRMDAQQKF